VAIRLLTDNSFGSFLPLFLASVINSTILNELAKKHPVLSAVFPEAPVVLHTPPNCFHPAVF